MQNLTIAFPQKTEKEKQRIAKDFYHLFIDTFVETIKLISISKKTFLKHIEFDGSLLEELSAKQQNIQMHSGHFFNYEFMNFASAFYLKNNWLGVYAPIGNKAFDKIMYDMRSRFGTILIANKDFKSKFHTYSKQPYTLGLAADQNPHNPNNAFWINFFCTKTAFVKGPEKGAKNQNAAVVMVYIRQVKRGYYKLETTLLTTTPNETSEGFITKALVNFIEDKVKKYPANYLWSHKRWKHKYNEAKYGHLLVD